MSVEVALNTPLADALSNVVQPKLTEVGWITGGLDDSALGEYIILMLVNGKTQEQIASELSNDLLSLGPDDSGAIDFAKWLFEQVQILNEQINGEGPAPQVQQTQGQAIPSYQDESRRESDQIGGFISQDRDISENMEDVQDGSMYGIVQGHTVETLLTEILCRPTGPKSMRSGPRNGNKRLMGQLSKAMDRSSDNMLHRVRSQQGTERINGHHRQPPKGPRNDQGRIQRATPNLRPTALPNGGMNNSQAAAGLANATPQQQMQLLAMLEEQARMMSQIFSPQQQSFMPGMPVPTINPNFRPGGPPQPQQSGRSLFERVDRNPQGQNGSFPKRQQPDANQNPITGEPSSSMEVESSQKDQSETSSDTICRFNLKCTKKDCPYAHQSPAAPLGITMDLSSDCPFGARCQNRKCVMKHPSPSQNPAHSTVEECRFFPNCTNPTCPFRHPPIVPLCRFGDSCTREGCKFKHVSITCKFNPCLNPTCPYKHAEGQKKGKFGDKVWTANGDGAKEHVSERKFVDDEMVEELVVPANNQAQSSQPSSAGAEVVT